MSPPRRAWLSAKVRVALVVSAIVGTTVSVGHALAPIGAAWPMVHALLPALVFSHSALRKRPVPGRVWARGIVVVIVVGYLFTFVNGSLESGIEIRSALNYAIPFAVSLLGSHGPVSAPHSPVDDQVAHTEPQDQ